MPARQGRAALGDVLRVPQHAAGVDFPGGLVVEAPQVELTARDAIEHRVDHLIRCPGRRGLLGDEPFHHAGVGEAGDQQVRGNPAALLLAQRVGEAFGQRFHAGLADVIGGVAGGLGDALLRAGVDHQPRCAAFRHGGDEALRDVDHAHQVDAKDAVPPGGISKDITAAADTGIAHQHRDRAEARGELCHRRAVRDVDDVDAGSLADFRFCGFELVRRDIDQRDPHAHAGQSACSGKADAVRRSGDDGEIAGGDGGMDRAAHCPSTSSNSECIAAQLWRSALGSWAMAPVAPG